MFENSIRLALEMTCILSGVPLAAVLIAGLIISFIQSSLQLQEQSFNFVVKLSALACTLYLFGTIALERLIELFHDFVSSSLSITL